MSVGSRIKNRRKSLGLSAEDVASCIGVSPATIYRYESGGIESMRTDKLVPIANALDTTPSYLMGWTDDPNENHIPDTLPVMIRRVPILGGAACGEPIYKPGDGTEYLSIENDVPCDFALIAHGDSMIGDRIFDGDVVFFRAQENVLDGEIAAVCIDDGVTIKRVNRVYGADGFVSFTQLLSSNPKFAPIIIGGEGETRSVHIMGKAVAFKALLNQ